MALGLSKNSSQGISCTYHKVMQVSFDARGGGQVLVQVGMFVDQAQRQVSDEPVDYWTQMAVPFDAVSSSNLLTQVYIGLKALPDFSGASDV